MSSGTESRKEMKINFSTAMQNSPNSFNGRQEVMKLAEEFSTELVSRFKRESPTIEKAVPLIKKYIPEIKIGMFKEAGKQVEIGGFSQNFVYTKSTGIFTPGEMLILLTNPKRGIQTRSSFIGNIAHEMTHAFQSKDPDISEINLMNNFLKINSEQDGNAQINAAYSVWDFLERNLFYPIGNTKDKIQTVEKFPFPFNITMNKTKFAEYLDKLQRKIKKNIPNADMDYIKKFIRHKLLNEADAYEIGSKTSCKYERKPFIKSDKPFIKLYRDCERII